MRVTVQCVAVKHLLDARGELIEFVLFLLVLPFALVQIVSVEPFSKSQVGAGQRFENRAQRNLIGDTEGRCVIVEGALQNVDVVDRKLKRFFQR